MAFQSYMRQMDCLGTNCNPGFFFVLQGACSALGLEPAIRYCLCCDVAVSMLMFSTFEQTVDILYRDVIGRRKEDCSRAQQLGVTCVAGYAAGAIGTVVKSCRQHCCLSL
ncbi:mitochondrial phosphate carrier protein 1, mitochondrial isoform X1 [Cinnamomum micranthum f. kanehirae]|uniref:Mitochondrial phosphate carrier protein 1, mitochondrial isoform X1 n=1 Tax=Cinnamomum micranthum f. kanehirae TaxID=337451 RepID=A0A443PIF4_9MAGN|nr:mitochondrial phosphate carrier protein 1, mitochondrial isoform X1 [Cinnamomum micranthum f. kanehirae]